MEVESHIELDEELEPLVGKFGEFSNKHLFLAMAVLSYLGPLSLGFSNPLFFLQSPLVRWVALPMKYLASAICFVPAYLTAGLVLGQWEFATESIWELHGNTSFGMGISLMTLWMVFALPLSRIINRIATSYSYRMTIFIITLCLIGGSLLLIIREITISDIISAYIFSFSILGFLYVGIFLKLSQKSDVKRERKLRVASRKNRTRPERIVNMNRFRNSNFQEPTNLNDISNLRDIFNKVNRHSD